MRFVKYVRFSRRFREISDSIEVLIHESTPISCKENRFGSGIKLH